MFSVMTLIPPIWDGLGVDQVDNKNICYRFIR